MPAKPLAPTTLSQYVRLNNCDRYLWYRLFEKETQALRKRLKVTEQPLTPLLSESGDLFEDEVLHALDRCGYKPLDLRMETAEAAVQRLAALRAGKSLALTQAAMKGTLGGHPCAGRSDLILARRPKSGPMELVVADIKASRQERVEHRLQVAVYVQLLTQMLADASVPHTPMQGAIIHKGEDGRLPDFEAEGIPTFRLDPYLMALENLTQGDASVLERILKTPFDALSYHLNYKCDGCMYNAVCMTESNLRQDLSIIPHLGAIEKRVLKEKGVHTVQELAALKEWSSPGDIYSPLVPAPGKEATVEQLSAWPVGPVLDTLVLRARAVAHRWDNGVTRLPFLPGGKYSELPVGDDLVRIYIDAQHDYLQDRVYLLAALVAGPEGEVPVVHMTDTVPDTESERDLFVAWVQAVGKAALRCAGSSTAKVHLFVYDRYDQKVLLEGLKRHLHAVAAIPSFYDLLTQTAALTQPMVSFLATELKNRRTSAYLNQSLVRAAGMLGFNWEDVENQYWRLFQARIFDDRRTEGEQSIEVAARFNSQIPLEYVYHVWGQLPESEDATEQKLLQPYRRVNRDHLLGFQQRRVEALKHIEEKLRPSKSKVEKDPVDLSDIGSDGRPAPDLAAALEHFLYIEHHAKVQELLELYHLPIAQRALTGRALLLECTHAAKETATFRICYSDMAMDPTMGPELIRFKEGSWCVLNPLLGDDGEEVYGKRLAHGRLCAVDGMTIDQVSVGFRFAGNGDSEFKFKHWGVPVQQGGYYTLDEMADDLNGDKLVDGCRNGQRNLLVQMADPGWRKPAPAYLKQASVIAGAFLQRINSVEAPYSPTATQAEVISGQLREPVVLVQGPPGTGKSHTLGWAVLARLLAMSPQRGPRLVVVSSKTHNAVNIVLGSIAQKWQKLKNVAPRSPETQQLGDLRVYKVGGDNNEHLPAGVQAVDLYSQARVAREIVQRDLTVIGATPGGLYNLMKKTTGLQWNQGSFSLAVLDEASQMSLPEAVLACGFLAPGGQALVVGDHRQMPPILAHGWKEEERREAETYQPYRSVFEFLLSLGTPRVGLDESFRLHRVIADFLAENIYRQDGIPFFSRRTVQLPAASLGDAFVEAALNPAYPIVVIEHADERSQQANHLEADLVAPIVQACTTQLGLDGETGVGIVVPHRAQKALLSSRMVQLQALSAVDTVERFQGGERDVVIVSATVSDPDYALAESEFLMDARRLNVALSRPKKKLIVIGAASLFRLLPSDPDVFEQASIWKLLRFQYSDQELWSGSVGGVQVRMFGRPG